MDFRRLLFGFLSFAFAAASAQNHAVDCRKYVAGAFYEQKGNDTLILFRGLYYWIEADVKRHKVNVYNISWRDGCNFGVSLNNGLAEGNIPAQDQVTPALRTMYLAFHSSYVNSISYSNLIDTTIKVILTPLYDTTAWKYLIDADTLLYSDTSEIKKLYGLPLREYSDNVLDFIKNITDTAECRFADYMFSLLEAGDVTPCFDYASPVLTRSSDKNTLSDYNQYIQHVYGKLLNYEFFSVQQTYSNRQNVPPIDNFIFTANFEKVSEKLKICMSIARGYHLPLVSVNVVADNPAWATYIDTLTSGFRKLLKKQEFKEIYETASPDMKSRISYEAVKKNLEELYKRGHLDEYKLFFQTFRVVEKKGGIDAGYKCMVNGKTYQINLTYSYENGEYKLAGLNASVN